MFNTIGYYYGYFKSWMGFNQIGPGRLESPLDEANDEEPESSVSMNYEDETVDENGQVFAAQKTVTYLYYSYKNYNNSFAVRGFSKDKTNIMIQNAFNEMSAVSGLKIMPWRKGKSVNFSIEFSSKVTYNALAVTDKSRIIVSNTRPMTEKVVKTVLQHELLHYLKYKASQPADKYYHSRDNICVYNINGNAPKLCQEEINWLRSKYGQP